MIRELKESDTLLSKSESNTSNWGLDGVPTPHVPEASLQRRILGTPKLVEDFKQNSMNKGG